MKKAVKNVIRLLLIPIFFCTLLFGIGLSEKTAFAEEQTVYDVEKEYPGATGDYAQVSGSGGPNWYFQALDTVGFYAYGTIGSDSDTGALATDTTNTTLQLYPLVRDGNQGNGTPTELKDGSGNKNLDYLVQYPAGNGIAYSDAEIGTGYYTSSQQYLRISGGQSVHPGTNLSVVYSFRVPKSGSVYLKDDIRVVVGGNGVRLAVYHQPKENTGLGYGAWGGSVAMSLYGAKPVFPTPKTNIQASGEGWQLIQAGSTYRFITDNIDVVEGDILHFILDANGDITNDQTFFAPKVVYGQRPDELTLDKSEVTLAAPAEGAGNGETYKLTATIAPAASAGKTVTYSTSNGAVATVDENGLITAVGEGTATITATLQDGVSEDENPVTAVCRVTVVPPDDSISIVQSGEELTIEQAHTLQLSYRILPPSSSGKTVVWSIVGESPEAEGDTVITLSDKGLVTAKNAGTATVRVAIADSEAYAECTVTVTKASDPVLSVNKQSVNILAGNSATVLTEISPLFHENDEVTVVSSDGEIATAEWEAGTLTVSAKGAGTATLTLSVRDGNSVEITVNVLAESDKVYGWRSSFRNEQGPQWHYYMLKEGEENYSELRYSTSEWGAYEENTAQMLQAGGWVPKAAELVSEGVDGSHNQYLLLWQGHMIHPGKGYDAVLGFCAPLTGTLDFMSYFRSYDSRSDGVRIRVFKGDEQIFPAAGRQLVSYGNPVEAAVCNLTVTAGDMFYIVVDCNEANAFDSCYLDPEFRYTDFEVVPDRLEIKQSNVSVSAGKDMLLTATIISTDGNDKQIKWTSSDETVATVNRFGIVSAKKTGTVTITAELADGTKAECTLTVTAEVQEKTEGGGMESWKIAMIAVSCAVAVAVCVGIALTVVLKKRKNRNSQDGGNADNENNGDDQDE